MHWFRFRTPRTVADVEVLLKRAHDDAAAYLTRIEAQAKSEAATVVKRVGNLLNLSAHHDLEAKLAAEARSRIAVVRQILNGPAPKADEAPAPETPVAAPVETPATLVADAPVAPAPTPAPVSMDAAFGPVIVSAASVVQPDQTPIVGVPQPQAVPQA